MWRETVRRRHRFFGDIYENLRKTAAFGISGAVHAFGACPAGCNSGDRRGVEGLDVIDRIRRGDLILGIDIIKDEA